MTKQTKDSASNVMPENSFLKIVWFFFISALLYSFHSSKLMILFLMILTRIIGETITIARINNAIKVKNKNGICELPISKELLKVIHKPAQIAAIIATPVSNNTNVLIA